MGVFMGVATTLTVIPECRHSRWMMVIYRGLAAELGQRTLSCVQYRHERYSRATTGRNVCRRGHMLDGRKHWAHAAQHIGEFSLLLTADCICIITGTLSKL